MKKSSWFVGVIFFLQLSISVLLLLGVVITSTARKMQFYEECDIPFQRALHAQSVRELEKSVEEIIDFLETNRNMPESHWNPDYTQGNIAMWYDSLLEFQVQIELVHMKHVDIKHEDTVLLTLKHALRRIPSNMLSITDIAMSEALWFAVFVALMNMLLLFRLAMRYEGTFSPSHLNSNG